MHARGQKEGEFSDTTRAVTDAFPSPAWCVRAIASLNADADLIPAARGWQGDFGVIIDRPEGPLAISLGEPQDGQFPTPRFVDELELARLAPRYFARATQEDWWALIEGRLDPIAAIVQKRLLAKGDLTQMVMRLQYKGLARRWLATLRKGD